MDNKLYSLDDDDDEAGLAQSLKKLAVSAVKGMAGGLVLGNPEGKQDDEASAAHRLLDAPPARADNRSTSYQSLGEPQRAPQGGASLVAQAVVDISGAIARPPIVLSRPRAAGGGYRELAEIGIPEGEAGGLGRGAGRGRNLNNHQEDDGGGRRGPRGRGRGQSRYS